MPFREFVGGKFGPNLQLTQAYLAKEVLEEIPDQVTGFMKKIGVKPKPPTLGSRQSSVRSSIASTASAPYPGQAPAAGQAPYTGAFDPPPSYSAQPGQASPVYTPSHGAGQPYHGGHGY